MHPYNHIKWFISFNLMLSVEPWISIEISFATNIAFEKPVSLYLVKRLTRPCTNSIAVSISISFFFYFSCLLIKLIEDNILYKMIIDTKNSKSPTSLSADD